MYRWFLLCVLLIGLVLLIDFSTIGQELDKPTDRIADLLSDDASVRDRARNALAQERARIIKRLEEGITSKAQHAVNLYHVRNGMNALADMHAVESTEFLIRYVGYPFTAEGPHTSPPLHVLAPIESQAPAVTALVRIGPSCVEPVISRLKSTDQHVERIALIAVLKELSTPYTRERLVVASEKSDDQERANLATALRIYDEWIPAAERTKRLLERLKELPLTPPTGK
jgi:hypothetical protein